MMNRILILPILALGLLPAISPAQARDARPAISASPTSHAARMFGKDDKPRKPKPRPGPTDGTDGDG